MVSAPQLRDAAIARDELVDVVHRQIVERCGEEVELRVLALQRQESAEQRFGGGADDEVDVADLEGRGDIAPGLLGALLGVTQFVVGVVGGKHIDAELGTDHGHFEVMGGRNIVVGQRFSVTVEANAADFPVEGRGDQRGEELQRRLIHRVQFFVGAPEVGSAQVVDGDGAYAVTLEVLQDVDNLMRAAQVCICQRGSVSLGPTSQPIGYQSDVVRPVFHTSQPLLISLAKTNTERAVANSNGRNIIRHS